MFTLKVNMKTILERLVLTVHHDLNLSGKHNLYPEKERKSTWI